MGESDEGVPQHPHGSREPLERRERRLDATDETLDPGDEQAANGVAPRGSMLAPHLHHIDERREPVERKIGA